MHLHWHTRFLGLMFCLLLALLNSSAQSQSGATTSPKLTMQSPLDQTGTGIVRDALGRPCLDIEAAARRHTVNQQMLDHVVSMKNNCPKLIKARVCYLNSERCNEVEVRPYGRADTILGTMNGITFFRYSINQK